MNKLEGIHAEYRNFDLEVLAGRPDTNVLLVRCSASPSAGNH